MNAKTARRANVAFPAGLIARIDEAAKRLGKTRSAFVVEACIQALAPKRIAYGTATGQQCVPCREDRHIACTYSSPRRGCCCDVARLAGV